MFLQHLKYETGIQKAEGFEILPNPKG